MKHIFFFWISRTDREGTLTISGGRIVNPTYTFYTKKKYFIYTQKQDFQHRFREGETV